jgi:SAM-dependent methyltransferase
MGEWYQNWFADERYLELYRHRNDEEADKLISLVEQVTGDDRSRRVLDIPCGAGRHLFKLADRGYKNLYGRDLSETFITHARLTSQRKGYDVHFAVGDMREGIEGGLDLILNLFTSFGYFENDKDNERVVANFSSALGPGGFLVIDFFNAVQIRDHLIPEETKILESGVSVRIHRQIIENRVIKSIRFESDGKEFIESVRLYQLEDFRRMLAAGGLTLHSYYGDYDGNTFEAERSPRLILFAQKST